MRLFIAVNFTEEVKNKILEVQNRLRSIVQNSNNRGNFTRPENLHITLAFLGETPEVKLPELLEIINRIPTPALEITFNRTGYFRRYNSELWWIGASPDDNDLYVLALIQKKLLRDLQKAGFHVDAKPFKAHITIARDIKHNQNDIILDCPDIVIPVDRLSLMKSERIQGVLTYTIVG